MHGLGLALVVQTSLLGAPHLRREKVRAGVKPAGGCGVAPQLTGFPREQREYSLRDFLGAMGVTANLPQSRRINHRKVPVHERRE